MTYWSLSAQSLKRVASTACRAHLVFHGTLDTSKYFEKHVRPRV